MEIQNKLFEKSLQYTENKQVICHPHLKLVKENSDFRIYFTWKDEEVGEGKHVLVGRIGRHGWKKRR